MLLPDALSVDSSRSAQIVGVADDAGQDGKSNGRDHATGDIDVLARAQAIARFQTAGAVAIVDQWLDDLRQLSPLRPPAGVPSKQWDLFLRDIAAFLEARHPDDLILRCAELGWEAKDLFGIPASPDDADCGGVIWRLQGARIIGIEPGFAQLQGVDGKTATVFRHWLNLARSSLPWDAEGRIAT